MLNNLVLFLRGIISFQDRIWEEIKDIAPSSSFLCNQLEFIVPDINMQFHRVKTYALGVSMVK